MEFPNILHQEVCDGIIDLFEKRTDLQYSGQTSSGVVKEHKDSTEICITSNLLSQSDWNEYLNKVFVSLQDGLDRYKKQFSYEKDIGIDNIADWKIEEFANIQRFYPGQGYKIWHCESPNKRYCDRVLVWMIYLNDIDDNGGTEFYFQDKIVKAEKGKLVIWPPYWTHFHKSQISSTQTKYIITGWFNFL